MSGFDKCKECNRKCKYYCLRDAYARFYEELNEKIDSAGAWKDGAHFSSQVTLQFCGMEIVLNEDGTYYLSDTTGG